MFSLPHELLGTIDVVQHVIDTQSADPIKVRRFMLPHNQREVLKKISDQLFKDGMIRPSKSPWSFPMFLVGKKCREMRPVVNYRLLNKVTKPDVYPTPQSEECFDALSGSTFFSALDYRSGYF